MTFDGLPPAALAFFAFALLSTAAPLVSVINLWRFRRRRQPTPTRWPSISVLKPMAGTEDDLVPNLETHLAIDYPGEWELVLGVRDVNDAAWGPAKAFVEAHPERARLVLQEGTPGRNPKVNQLITLTRHSRGEYIAVTDSGVRAHAGLLREHAAALSEERVALSSHAFAGVGEETVGAALDNTYVASFAANCIATGDFWGLQQIVGKSLCIKRAVLEEIGGWETVKDLLAEDQRLGRKLTKARYRTAMSPNFVEAVVRRQPVSGFFARHVRWQMIRFLVIPHMATLELLINPTPWALLGLLAAPTHVEAWLGLAAICAFSIAHVQLSGLLTRGSVFSWHYALLVPLRDLLVLPIWLQGLFQREVVWRGNRLKVLWKTRLVSDETLVRLRRLKGGRRPVRLPPPPEPVPSARAGS